MNLTDDLEKKMREVKKIAFWWVHRLGLHAIPEDDVAAIAYLTLVQCERKWDPDRGEAQFSSYVTQAARRNLVQAFRWELRHQPVSDTLLDIHAAPDPGLERVELADCLSTLRRRLPSHEQALFDAMHAGTYNMAEVARQQDWPWSTGYARLKSMQRRLKDAVQLWQ